MWLPVVSWTTGAARDGLRRTYAGHGRQWLLLPADRGKLLVREQERTPEHAGVPGDGPVERVARALHQSCSPPSRGARWSNGSGTIPAAAAAAQVRLTVRIRTRHGGELAGLEVATNGLVDLELGGVGVGAARMATPQTAQLEDTEPGDKVGALP